MASVTGAASTLFSTTAHPAVVAAAHAGPLSLSSATFAGSAGGVVATQTTDGSGNTIIHLEDGSTITVVGVAHFDSTFVH
jgi:hypothetical protein